MMDQPDKYKGWSNEQRKQETLRLYSLLPQDKDVPDEEDAMEARAERTDIRDEIVLLNYSFFGFVAAKTNVHNPSVSFDDKFQCALTEFMGTGVPYTDRNGKHHETGRGCWYKYMWEGHYRCDLSFSVFFYLRLSECVDRALSVVQYSQYRPLQMEVAKVLDKPWMKVTYDDLKDPRLKGKVSGDHLESLARMFGVIYEADLETHELFIPGEEHHASISDDYWNDNYDSIEDLLMREMIDRERKLSAKDQKDICKLYDLDPIEVEKAIPKAEEMLYKKLHEKIDINSYDADE